MPHLTLVRDLFWEMSQDAQEDDIYYLDRKHGKSLRKHYGTAEGDFYLDALVLPMLRYKTKHFPPEDLARRLGVSEGTVSKWRGGTQRPSHIAISTWSKVANTTVCLPPQEQICGIKGLATAISYHLYDQSVAATPTSGRWRRGREEISLERATLLYLVSTEGPCHNAWMTFVNMNRINLEDPPTRRAIDSFLADLLTSACLILQKPAMCLERVARMLKEEEAYFVDADHKSAQERALRMPLANEIDALNDIDLENTDQANTLAQDIETLWNTTGTCMHRVWRCLSNRF